MLYRPVQLRVLRLNKPQLASVDHLGKDIYVDGMRLQQSDPLLSELINATSTTTTSSDGDRDCTNYNEPDLGLVLPKGFGKVLAGELFACLLVVQADHDYQRQQQDQQRDTSVQVSVSIQLPKGNDVEILKPTQVNFQNNQGVDYKCFVLKYSLKEAGSYALAVNVAQVDPQQQQQQQQQQQRSFRELYRFIAQQCLALRTKVSHYNSSVIVQAQIENISDSSVMLESADYLPSSPDVKVNRLPKQLTKPILRSKDIYQYAYVISHKDRHSLSPESTTAASHTGRVSLAWRREPFGERGYLATSPLRLMST